jgi:hypothetical protein
LDSLLKILLAALLSGAAAIYGCASGPVVGREVLADPAMRFEPGNSIEVLDSEAQVRARTDAPMPPNTIMTTLDFAREPGGDVDGTAFFSSLRAAVEIFSGFGLEAGYGLSVRNNLVQKLDGFAGPVGYDQTRHGPDAALVLDDGTSVFRGGYRYRTSWDGELHEPSVSARTSVLRHDTILEVGYRHGIATVTVPADKLPAEGKVDDEYTVDRLYAALEQGFLPGWNLRMDVAIMLEEGFLQSPFRLVSLWSQRDPSSGSYLGVPRTEPENHPDSRFRWGALFRVRRVLPALKSVFELGAGHGSGSWRVEHSQASAAYLQRLGEQFTLQLRGGAYHQTRASFYRDEYPAAPPGAYWSADRTLCSFVAWWGEPALVWTIIPERGRVLSMFKYLTMALGAKIVSVDYAWEGLDKNNGFTSYPSLAAGQTRRNYDGGLSFGGYLGIEGGF